MSMGVTNSPLSTVGAAGVSQPDLGNVSGSTLLPIAHDQRGSTLNLGSAMQPRPDSVVTQLKASQLRRGISHNSGRKLISCWAGRARPEPFQLAEYRRSARYDKTWNWRWNMGDSLPDCQQGQDHQSDGPQSKPGPRTVLQAAERERARRNDNPQRLQWLMRR